MKQLDLKYLSILIVLLILLTQPVISQPQPNDLQGLEKKKIDVENLSYHIRELKQNALNLRNSIIQKDKKEADKINQSVEINMKEIIFWSEKRNEELRYEQSRKRQELAVNNRPPLPSDKDTLRQVKDRNINPSDGRVEDRRMEDGRMDPRMRPEEQLKNQQILLETKNKRLAREKEIYASFQKHKIIFSDTTLVRDNEKYILIDEFTHLLEEELKEMQVQLQKEEEEQLRLMRQEFNNRKNTKEHHIPQEHHNEQK